MWTEEHRLTYRRSDGLFPSDMTEAEWKVLGPLIPDATPGGRPRKTDMRSAMNAILYLLRTGCPWRYLPRDGFPPRSTVYNIFRKFQADGTWTSIWDQLYPMLREREGREGSPSARRQSDDRRQKKGVYSRPIDRRRTRRSGLRCRKEDKRAQDPLAGRHTGSADPAIRPASRTAMGRHFSSTGSSPAFPGWSVSSLIRGTMRSRPMRRLAETPFGSKSSGAIRTPSASKWSNDDGLWKGPSLGSVETDASPRISKTSPPPSASHWPPSSSDQATRAVVAF